MPISCPGLGTITCVAALLAAAAVGKAADFPAFAELPTQAELPPALKMLDGTPVTSKEQWFAKRRPEIKALLEHYEYGKAPPPPEKVEAKVVRENAKFLDGKATLREVTLKFGPEAAPPIHLLLVIPNQRKGPAPVFVGLNFRGNHTVTDDPGVALAAGWVEGKNGPGVENNRATETGRGTQKNVWCVDLLVERGYALATAYYGDIFPDKNDFSAGLVKHYFANGQTERAAGDWGAIRAWAYGLSRMVDHVSGLPEIDKNRVAAIGHSRLGKTALVAGAFDERIALVVPHQSGTGGCALNRKNDQETVERINKVFPHWFCVRFRDFGGHEDKLPTDQHLLMSLVAPRALLDTEGDQDKWANYESGRKALQAADEVYKFLGSKGLCGTGIVHGDEPIKGANFGPLLQYRRDWKHELNRDYWQKILEYSDAYYASAP